MRCAALHRKLGTHITKVKSLSMDSWSTEQVEVRTNTRFSWQLLTPCQNMKRVGNVASNRIYNPDNTRPPIPFDADEADSAMERFIRGKYQERATSAQARHNTGSTNSDDHPPPLPPKTGHRFGFRSASSIFPLSSKARREAAAARPDPDEQFPSSPPRNKPSRIFGTDSPDDLESKLSKLRDMGFRDDKRNMSVLKGLGGNLERSIETLVRLGEGGISGNGSARSGGNSGPSSRSRTPITLPSPGVGITVNRTRQEKSSVNPSNPFDFMDEPAAPAPPQSSQSTGSLAQPQMMGNNPFQQSGNTISYGVAPSQSQYGLNQAFQNIAISPSQPLFPNHTGGVVPGQQQPQFQQLYQQSMTPPVPSLPQQFYPSVIYENQAQQPQSYNPFMQQQQQQQPQPQQQIRQAPPINTNFQTNPYMQPQQQLTPQATPVTSFQSKPYATNSYSQAPIPAQGYVHSPMKQPSSGVQQQNPFFQNNQQQEPPSSYQVQIQPQAQQQYDQQFQQFRVQTHPSVLQQTGRADKRSILDLYNYPQLAPNPLQQSQQPNPPQPPLIDTQQQQRSVSNPVSAPAGGSRNPFAINSGAQSAGGDTVGQMPIFQNQNGTRHVSQESVDAGGWQSGRHSPDAWGTISARSMR